MFELEIPFTCNGDVNFKIKIDNLSVKYEIFDSKIFIKKNIPIGLHILSISNSTDSRISFTNVIVNKTNIRQYFYLSWVCNNESKIQPCTELWSKEQTWNIPISNPLSLLISVANEKFKDGELGQDLYKKYNIFYPESIEIDSTYPQLVKDFFKHNFNFHVYPKVLDLEPFAQESIPYIHFKYDYCQEKIFEELKSNEQYLFSKEKIPTQTKYNLLDSQVNKGNWRTIFTFPFVEGKKYSLTDFTLDKDKLPILYNFYTSLPLKNIYYSFLGYLSPGGYIAPHTDPSRKNMPGGCSQLYFAINAKAGNLLKIHNVGLVPFHNKPTLFNNQSFSHCLVNQSNEPRWVISILGDVNQDFTLLKEYE